MQRGHAQVEAQFVYRLQTLGGFGGKADQLNAYSVFLNDPGYFERDLARYAGVTQQDLHRRRPKVSAHGQSRGGERRAERQALACAAGFDAGGGVVTRADRSRLPAVGPPLPFRFSRIDKDRLLESPVALVGRTPDAAGRHVHARAAGRFGCRFRGVRRARGHHRRHDGRRHGQSVGDRRERAPSPVSARTSKPRCLPTRRCSP